MVAPSYYRLLRILGEYVNEQGVPDTDGRWHEIGEKLKELDFLEEKILRFNKECGEESAKSRAAMLSGLHEDPQRYFQRRMAEGKNLMELKTSTEAYYHAAWSLQELLKTIPGLNKLDLRSIRLVRGDLLVHAQRYIASFSWGGPGGPTIKPDEGHKYVDPGFCANVAAMKRQLFDILKKLSPKKQKEALEGPEFPIGL